MKVPLISKRTAAYILVGHEAGEFGRLWMEIGPMWSRADRLMRGIRPCSGQANRRVDQASGLSWDPANSCKKSTKLLRRRRRSSRAGHILMAEDSRASEQKEEEQLELGMTCDRCADI